MSEILYFDDTKGFYQGVATVKIGDKWGAIDIQGNQIIPFIYDSLSRSFSNKIIASKDGKKGIVDTKNNIVAPFVYDDIGSWENFLEKDPGFLQEALLDSFLVVKQANKYGAINKEGHEILRCEYDKIIKADSFLKITKGNECIYAKEDSGEIISKDTLKTLKKNQETINVGFIDSTYDPFISVSQYETEFNKMANKIEKEDLLGNGLKLVELKKKYGIMNDKNNIILPIEYDNIYAKHHFLITEKNNKHGLLTDKTERITDDIYDEIDTTNTKYIIVKNNNLYGVINDRGEIILPTIYDYIDNIHDENDQLTSNLIKFIEANIETVDRNAFYKPVLAKLNNKYGFLDFSYSNAKTIIPFEYDAALDFVNGFCAVQKNGKWCFLNFEGEALKK